MPNPLHTGTDQRCSFDSFAFPLSPAQKRQLILVVEPIQQVFHRRVTPIGMNGTVCADVELKGAEECSRPDSHQRIGTDIGWSAVGSLSPEICLSRTLVGDTALTNRLVARAGVLMV